MFPLKVVEVVVVVKLPLVKLTVEGVVVVPKG
jgi:hypothetical protein